MRSVGLPTEHYIEHYVRFYGVFVINLVAIFSFFYKYVTFRSLVTCNISMMSSMQPMECLFSIKCVANFDLLLYFNLESVPGNVFGKTDQLARCTSYYNRDM